MAKIPAWISWSSGKDSAWALEVVRREGQFEVTAMLSTLNAEAGRVAMHGVRESLLRQQALQTGLRLISVPLPWPCSNQEYERQMELAMAQARAEGINHVIFGDLFLEDIRRYREEKMAACGMTPVFPLWGRPTAALAREMIAGGLRAWIACVDCTQISREFAGREFDQALLQSLPPAADPCGENGEFHTFCSAGPMFRGPIAVAPGQVVNRENFAYADLIPAAL
jgi:uncharacterized protein (TIGR00290 family)